MAGLKPSLWLAVMLLIAATAMAQEEGGSADDAAPEAAADAVGGIPEGVNCADGLIVPIWKPYENLSGGDRFGRGLLYILLMVYLFIGVAIVSDRSALIPIFPTEPPEVNFSYPPPCIRTV